MRDCEQGKSERGRGRGREEREGAREEGRGERRESGTGRRQRLDCLQQSCGGRGSVTALSLKVGDEWVLDDIRGWDTARRRLVTHNPMPTAMTWG